MDTPHSLDSASASSSTRQEDGKSDSNTSVKSIAQHSGVSQTHCSKTTAHCLDATSASPPRRQEDGKTASNTSEESEAQHSGVYQTHSSKTTEHCLDATSASPPRRQEDGKTASNTSEESEVPAQHSGFYQEDEKSASNTSGESEAQRSGVYQTHSKNTAHGLDSAPASPPRRQEDGKSDSNSSKESNESTEPNVVEKDLPRPRSDDDIVTVEFYAVLKDGITFQSEESLWICGQQGKIKKMSLISEQNGRLFKASIFMDKSEIFVYKYCTFSPDDQQIRSEQITLDGNDTYFRLLDVKEVLQSDCKVVQQYDDICMKSVRWGGLRKSVKTEILDMRLKFLQSVLDFALRTNNNELPYLENKIGYISKSFQRRFLFDPELNQEKKQNFQVHSKLGQALRNVIETFTHGHPVSYLLAAVFFAKYRQIELEQTSVKKLCAIAKTQARKGVKIPDLTDSIRREICIAIGHLLRAACSNHSTDAVWLLGLFYKVLSPDKRFHEDIQRPDSHSLKWISANKQCQADLIAMVESHEEQLQQHRDFAETILYNMFSVEMENHNVLKHLGLDPFELLREVYQWVCRYPDLSTEKLTAVIETVADITKKRFQSRQPEDVSDEEVSDCFSLAINIMKEMKKRKPSKLPESIISILKLLNSFSEVLDLLQGSKEIMDMCEKTYPVVEYDLQIWIMAATVKFTEHDLKFFTRVFENELPSPWQERWKKTLKNLFTECIQKLEPTQQINCYCNYSESNSTVEDCLMQCALKIVKYKVGYLDMIRKSKKCSQVISMSICDIWKDLKHNTSDWEYLLTNPHSLELLTVLGALQKEKPNYKNSLEMQARTLLTNTQHLLSKLHQNLYELPCKLTLNLVRDRSLYDILSLHLENQPALMPALNRAEHDIEAFKCKQRQSKALLELLHLAQDISVNTEQIRANILIDLSTESRPLNQLMKLWEGADIMKFEKMELAYLSKFFRTHWMSASGKVRQADDVAAMSLNDLHETLYKPALKDYIKTYEMIKDQSLHVHEFETVLGDCTEHQIERELGLMKECLGDNTENKWIEGACKCIKRYRGLCNLKIQAEVVYGLKTELRLEGNFQLLHDIKHKDVLKTKRLNYFTDELEHIGQTLTDVDDHVLSLLKEYKDCVNKDFIKWIKSIIKDQRELNVFVELASAFAGENPIDLDKVRNFRDAVFACFPLIFELDIRAGFDDLMGEIRKLKEPVKNDPALSKKLGDSCKYKEWLDTAHTAHGSVVTSSFLQADEINKFGVYYITQPSTHSTTIDDCIHLKIQGRPDIPDKEMTLSQLQDLQNKLMLITTMDEQGQNKTVSQFVEVLEQVLHAGQLLIKLREAGHILFTDWSFMGFCEENRVVSVHVDFGITVLKITGRESLLEELKGLCESMQTCLEKWLNYTKIHRDEYYYLNYFTAKQLSTLCCSMAAMQTHKQVSSSILNMLSFIKENVTVTDLQNAFTSALKSPIQNASSMDMQSSQIKHYLLHFPELIEYVVKAGYTEASAKAAVMFCKQSSVGLRNEDLDEDAVMDCVYENSNNDEWVDEWSVKYDEERESVLQEQLRFTGGHTPEQMKPAFSMSTDELTKMFENLHSCKEKILLLWDTYCGKLSGLVSDKYVGLDLLGETLNQLAERVDPVRRDLTRLLEKGRPNLVSCNSVEMLPQCLSLYLNREQPLPTYDEILICTAETTGEDVELIIRRALQSGSRHEKIYSLLNAENLNPEVARVLESNFCHLSQNQKATKAKDYSFVIFCNARAHHSYVLTAFDEYRKTLHPKEYKEIQQLLKIKHKLSSKVVFPESIVQEEFCQNIKMVASARAGMGKTLFVKNLIRRSKDQLSGQRFTNKTISITDKEIKPGFIYDQLKQYEDNPVDGIPRIFHFDVPPVVCKGLYTFLVQLFVLRCFQSLDGFIWKCKDCHIYLVEYTERKLRRCDREISEISPELEDSFLEMFTTVRCLSPEDTLDHLSGTICNSDKLSELQLMDDSEFRSEEFQRTYQYLKHFQEKRLQMFKFDKQKCPDSPKEWLKCILHYSKIIHPSWAELCHFTHFLNVQLKKCEESVFCSDMLRNDLTGFREFVVKFMITMSKDFTMPSLKTTDESDGLAKNEEKIEGTDDVLNEFQMRKHWEQEAHPYIMFNSDGVSMTFLGFHIQNYNAVDVRTGKIIEKDVISKLLLDQLKAQKVPMNVDFKTLRRTEQIEILCRVLGVTEKDPDSTYQLTLDNALKILAIHMRFECNIPVVIMGETGCGKTRLVKFMCDLLKKDVNKTNLLMVRVHGGTTSDMIYKKVEKAIEDSKKNRAHGMYTVLFFDEANTTEALYAIKEVMCDRTIRGEQIDAPDLKFIAACNPYRKHTQTAINQLEKAGLGYRVRAEDTSEKLGQIPMRQLVYRVQPLPASLSPLVWDFGKLNEHTQELYIAKMVESFFKAKNLEERYKSMFTNVINVSQTYMTKSKECRMVSLRDIERCMKTTMWFFQQKGKLFPLIDEKKKRPNVTGQRKIDDIVRSLILAVGVCYSASLEQRKEYIELTASTLSLTAQEMLEEIDLCQEVFIDNVDIPAATAKNDALKENVFMMIVCMNLRLPLFLVGKPGSSKSLSKTVAADALQGKSSHSELFKTYKQAQLLSFQCSVHSTSDGIISTFKQCAQLQKEKNLEEYVSVVVLDEIGLAEDSPKMPLKTLHPLLECGSIDDEWPEENCKVGFIGLSNWSLDPAKMNRGILLFRACPKEEELEKTAREIYGPRSIEIEENLSTLTKVYSEVIKNQANEFYGLRDYYSLIKVIVTYAQSFKPSNADLARAVQRNFGVLDSVNSLDIFSREFNVPVKPAKTIDLVRENLKTTERDGLESRYLLLMSSNNAALSILLSQGIISNDNTEVIFGSGFPLDQEYSQVCRTVNRVKTCMETGRSVVLLNIQNLYESLYDALNQCYVKLGGSFYVDLGLGTHRVKCKIKEGFRLIVIEEKNVVYAQFPTPLLSRLEKHCLEFNTILPEHAKQLQAETEKQVEVVFSGDTQNMCDALIGFTQDSCASVLLQCCPEILSEDWDTSQRGDILNQCRGKLVQCSTLDSVVRASRITKEIQNVYFKQQTHTNLMDVIKNYPRDNDKGLCLEVSTYSLLLNQRNLKSINEELNISKEQSYLLQIREFQTEQAFCEAVRKCFQANSEGRVLILIQLYFENSKLSQRLLSCARYCITKLLKESEEGTTVDAVLLIRLPRVSGGCGYIAMSGDEWDCVHLDELMPTKGLPADMQTLCKTPVSKVFGQSITHDDDGKQVTEKIQERSKLVDTRLLIKMCMQKAIIQLHDKADNSPRAQRRVEILYDLLQAKHDVSQTFFKVLERRVFNILTAREKEEAENWVITQARSNNFVVEGTSFRHVLWIHLEDVVASAMAPIFAVVDGDNNLDHVTASQPCDKTDLWIRIFQEEDLLTVPALPKQYYTVLSTSDAKETSVSCRFPFSWVVKERFDQIWRQIQNLPEISKLEQVEKCQELIKFPWLYNITSTHSLFNMYAADLVRMSMPECPYQINQVFSVSLVELAKNLYKDLMQADPNDVSLLWLHVTYEQMRDNHQIFHKLLQQCKDMINTEDVKEATEAMHLLLVKLQPKRELLANYATCQAWLDRVKSLSSSVELIISENSLIQHHGTKGEELLKKIRCLWQGTQVVYLLIDNLLQDENQMEEKLLDIIIMNFIHFSKRILKKDMNMEQMFMEVSRVLKQCNINACNTYLNIDCASCGTEFTDPVELSCGHIFCKTCIDGIDAKDCFTCSKPIDIPYKLCEQPTWEAIIQMNKFRSHCNSFFVEFIMKCCAGENTEIPDGMATRLLDFVRGSPKRNGKPSRKTTEGTPFHESMDPSPAVQSLVLRILLKSRMDQMGPHLQKYIETAVKSNQQNTDEFYFMVVRCTEDQIQRSAHKNLVSKAMECVNMDFSPSGRTADDVTFDVLHNIAKIRFAVSVATDVIVALVQTQGTHTVEDEIKHLFQRLQETLAKNKWFHIFLIRNLCNKFGFRIIQSIQRNEKLNWVVPKGLQAQKVYFIHKDDDKYEMCIRLDETGCPCDRFLVYGALYSDIVMDLTDTYNLKEKAAEQNSPIFPVCATLAAVRQTLHDIKSAKGNNSLIAQVEVVSKGSKNWQNMSAICKNVMEDRLSKVSKELRLSHDSSLYSVVLHTVIVVNQSTSPEMKLLKTICSQPGKMKKTFIPTMPDIQQQMEILKNPGSTETFWKCQCGEAVLIENCGRPMVVADCPQCRRQIGGNYHVPVPGFTQMQITDDQMGYILGDASKRSVPGCERNLSGASLCLVRALIHSCLLWGAIDNCQATKDLLAVSGCDVGKFFCEHLQKEIELLGEALGKNTENAEIAIHMFLRNIIERPSAYCTLDFETTETRHKRNEWENIMQAKTTTFFKDFEKNLSEVHNHILKCGGANPLVNIVYNEVPKVEGLSTTGPYNCSLMWRYERKMTIQHLTHLLEQDSFSQQYPVLLDLLRKHGQIQEIKHLPQFLSLQQKLIHHFHYVDSSEWKDLSFEEFLTNAPQADVPLLQEYTNVLMNIWEKIKHSNYLDIPNDLKEKDRNNIMIIDLLPLENPQTVMRIVTHYLAKLQNDCINRARIRQYGDTESENLQPSQVITCDLEEDFLPIAISNMGYIVNEDGTETIDYNFKTLEKQLINRFVSEKPHINLTTLPVMERNPVKNMQSFFSSVKDKLVPLSIQDKNYIMKEMRFINEISAALSTLKIAIGFLEISFSSTDMLLVKFMKHELRMVDRSKHLELPVLKTCRVKHIESLWEVLCTRRSVLLTEMNQEPFYMINQDFCKSFRKEEQYNVNAALGRIRNMDLFITELHNFIMNIETKEMKPFWDIQGTFEEFLKYDKGLDDNSVNSLLEHLYEDLKMTHVTSLWKLAVQKTGQ